MLKTLRIKVIGFQVSLLWVLTKSILSEIIIGVALSLSVLGIDTHEII